MSKRIKLKWALRGVISQKNKADLKHKEGAELTEEEHAILEHQLERLMQGGVLIDAEKRKSADSEKDEALIRKAIKAVRGRK